MTFSYISNVFHNIHGYQWILMDIHGYSWMLMDIHGYPGIFIDIHGYPRIFIDIHGYPRIFMDIHGYSWISMGSLLRERLSLLQDRPPVSVERVRLLSSASQLGFWKRCQPSSPAWPTQAAPSSPTRPAQPNPAQPNHPSRLEIQPVPQSPHIPRT